MARALFAWELGGELGHARRTQHIASHWRARGHEVAFAFPDLSLLGAPNDGALEWFQAPIIPSPRNPSISPLNASEILLNRGYGDAASVAGGLRGWLGLLGLYRPDVVVADYAPGAQLASRLAGVRSVAIGTGFSQPVAAEPMPVLRSWLVIDEGTLRQLDARVVSAVREAIERIDPHARAPASVGELLRPDLNLLCTWPEIDPFGEREGAEYIGPQDDPRDGTPIAWNAQLRPRVFAYLKPRDARFAATLEALRAVAGEAVVAAPGLAPAQAAMLSTPAVRVVPHAVALHALLPGADLCVCHAGPGIVGRALEAGVPLAMLPQQLEQYLVARRVASAGAGVLLAPDEAHPDLGAWLREALARAGLREAARTSTLRARVGASAAERIERFLAA